MRRRRGPSNRRSAVVLLAVLVVIVLLSLAAYKFNDWMMAEYQATTSSIKSNQAKALALSGIHYAAALLAGNIDETLGGNPYDNPEMFSNIEVPSTGAQVSPGRFSIYSLLPSDEAGNGAQSFRYGATDECGKINLNVLLQLDREQGVVGQKILMALPNMTEEIANSILDWIDTDETPRTNGAENEYYSGMDPPYRCKNGPLDSLEELLLVKGVTPQLLFGNDKNRNGVIDPDEDDGSGANDLGWSGYLTVYSREMNVNPDGKQRTNINDRDIQKVVDPLKQNLGDQMANYILAYRLYGGSSSTSKTTSASSDLSAIESKIQSDIGSGKAKAKGRLRTLWDLVDSQVTVTIGQGKDQKQVVFASPLNDPGVQRDILPKLFEYCSTSSRLDQTPRININTAPQTVISAFKEVCNLSDTDVQNIMGRRPQPSNSNAPDPIYKTPAWLMTDAGLKKDTLKSMYRYFNAQSQVYRVQSLGFYDKGGPTARMEAVIDTNMGRPRIVYFRDLSELGKGFDVGMKER